MSTKIKRRNKKEDYQKIIFISVALLFVGYASFAFFVYAMTEQSPTHIPSVNTDPNANVRLRVYDFFITHDAREMIPVIKCESEFKHYEPDGSVLKNKEGSSAIGVAQILSPIHPDPKILKNYNKRYYTNFVTTDFDISMLEDNLVYALILYRMRGISEWKCGQT